MAGILHLIIFCFCLSGVLAGFPIAIDRTGWTATADSAHAGNEASKAIDGSTTTFWHSEYNPVAALPHNIVIDMKTTYVINAVSYLPRQDGNGNGRIGQHKIELSTDGTNWATPVGTGTWLNDALIKKTTFVAKPARYIRLTALTEAQSTANQWSSAAEINVYRVGEYTSRTGWTVSADSQETSSESAPATNAIDGR